ncbi:Anthranilate 1,2-dioxygenase large subunit [Phycisphaerae bacterium RAS2]|nr:Anthranilate 1,2-dioxygenase large subunit [Phycisphaerae bacterium RAS2]
MSEHVQSILRQYDPTAPLEKAWTIPAPWYTDPAVAALEQQAVFGAGWQYVAPLDRLEAPGSFATAVVAGEPIVVVRGRDGTLRAFFNVCRHHAAAVATEECGSCSVLRCPYHGWTYDLDGRLKGAPEFEGVEGFDRDASGLMPVAVETWERFVFVRLSDKGMSLKEHLGDMAAGVAKLDLARLKFFERRRWTLNCNWKVYVDNYLDGGYHVPHLHKSLSTVLEYSDYQIENGARFCLQHSPLKSGKDAETAAVRKGDRAYYYWLHPNFMLNWYEGVMDVNLVLPLGPDRCEVIFDFFFDDVGESAAARNRASLAVGERVQQEDIDICEAVQRGLHSRAYVAGRLSVRREAGEYLFHRLLHADLAAGTSSPSPRL